MERDGDAMPCKTPRQPARRAPAPERAGEHPGGLRPGRGRETPALEIAQVLEKQLSFGRLPSLRHLIDSHISGVVELTINLPALLWSNNASLCPVSPFDGQLGSIRGRAGELHQSLAQRSIRSGVRREAGVCDTRLQVASELQSTHFPSTRAP